MSGPIPGAKSVHRLASALVERLGSQAIRWLGPPSGDEFDAIGWQLASVPRFLFSVSTHAGDLPSGRYDFQISIVDSTLENGEIVFLDEVGLQELCELAWSYNCGEVVERFGGAADA